MHTFSTTTRFNCSILFNVRSVVLYQSAEMAGCLSRSRAGKKPTDLYEIHIVPFLYLCEGKKGK